MIYCNNCGRYVCSSGINCCPHCGCRCEPCVKSILIGPQGIQGETGPQGIQGETGPQGIQGETGPQGIQGETGPQGIQGETGPQGIQGDSATNYTTANMSAIHTGGISLTVPTVGVAVPMPTTVMNGFTSNATYDTFTADYGGVYLLMYNIKTSVNTTVKTRIMRNGVQLSGTVRSTSVATANYSLSLLVRLAAGDQLQLQLYDLNNVVIGLQGGTGASLVLIRLSE